MAKGKQKGRHNERRQIKQKQHNLHASGSTPSPFAPDLTLTKKRDYIGGSREARGAGVYVRRERSTYPGMTIGSSDVSESSEINYKSLINKVPSALRPKVGITGKIEVSFVAGYKPKGDDTLVPPRVLRLIPERTVVDKAQRNAEYIFAYLGTFDQLAEYFKERPHMRWRVSNPAIYST